MSRRNNKTKYALINIFFVNCHLLSFIAYKNCTYHLRHAPWQTQVQRGWEQECRYSSLKWCLRLSRLFSMSDYSFYCCDLYFAITSIRTGSFCNNEFRNDAWLWLCRFHTYSAPGTVKVNHVLTVIPCNWSGWLGMDIHRTGKTDCAWSPYEFRSRNHCLRFCR